MATQVKVCSKGSFLWLDRQVIAVHPCVWCMCVMCTSMLCMHVVMVCVGGSGDGGGGMRVVMECGVVVVECACVCVLAGIICLFLAADVD